MNRTARTILSILLLVSSTVTYAQSALQNQLQKAADGKKQRVFIEKFAEQAKQKDTAAILAEMDASTIKSIGEVNIAHVLETKVFPFFSVYVKLHSYDQLTNATLPDGRAGLWHYTYISSATENMLPFRIAVIDTSDGPKILDVVVNECVKGRHPVCN